jgi:hypothetical protein
MADRAERTDAAPAQHQIASLVTRAENEAYERGKSEAQGRAIGRRAAAVILRGQAAAMDALAGQLGGVSSAADALKQASADLRERADELVEA